MLTKHINNIKQLPSPGNYLYLLKSKHNFLIIFYAILFIVQASPLDGGTDNGFTFTSPNWATQPQDSVFAITSTYPTHPAGSFNYPHLTRLPTIAVYSLTKVRFYFITLFICYFSFSYILASGVFFGAELRSNNISKWSCSSTKA